ncbi:tripartite tricarboxylate transporter TctB family protein [Kaustia mangrovi]|uniref:Tripartite tricarboxylate transporter TctB family protein n=1 Tax=Kaustia mangrovi TaxID=2593653 RepID=A0A7S8C6P1_9HYPH|nr:tripartite tricarboxylate transporter TctB family protein [Kaustia mangrovi]QPC44209.1 tripartite tricarboxylate transporter TctB family protein [Kaustia mangrovi]
MTEPRPTREGVAALPAALLPRDAVVALAILVFCAVAYWLTTGFDEAPAAMAQNIQPSTFPQLVITVMAVLAGVIFVQSFAAPQKTLARVPPLVPVSAGVMVAFVTAFQTLGIVPAMVLMCLGLPALWGERRWGLVIAFAVLFPAAIYGLFAGLLDVYFEPGPLIPW